MTTQLEYRAAALTKFSMVILVVITTMLLEVLLRGCFRCMQLDKIGHVESG